MADRIYAKEMRWEVPEYVHQRNVACTEALLAAILEHHSTPPAPPPPIIEEPKPLPPIPNKIIAKAAEEAFPNYINRISEIQRLVLKEFPKMTKSELLSNRRHKRIVRARQIGMYIAKRYTNKSFPEIGRRFGGRDHSTICHAVNKIEGLLTRDQELVDIITRIENELTEREALADGE